MRSRFALSLATALFLAACGGGGGEPAATDEPGSPGSAGGTPTTGGAEPAATIPPHLTVIASVWGTDFTNTVIDLNELQVGIPASDPRDAIPPIDDPVFDAVPDSDWLEGQEPGVLVEIGGEARFYPLSIMTRHEIVNDEIAGIPVAVTYCPLCNTAVVFDRRVDGEVLRLGVSGLLRNSDLVMWDDITQSLWQQITGEAIVGAHAGESLASLPSAIVRWADFGSTHPQGMVLAADQGFGRVYGFNPYEFYSSRARPYSFFQGDIDGRLPALERVVGVSIGEEDKAYPFSLINEVGVVNDTLAGEPLVVFWGAADTADALDSGVIAEGVGVGTGVVYRPVVGGQTLTFEAVTDTEFVDLETGTTWSILGKALEGELAGAELELLPHRNEFWFAWQAFFPEGDVWDG